MNDKGSNRPETYKTLERNMILKYASQTLGKTFTGGEMR